MRFVRRTARDCNNCHREELTYATAVRRASHFLFISLKTQLKYAVQHSTCDTRPGFPPHFNMAFLFFQVGETVCLGKSTRFLRVFF